MAVNREWHVVQSPQGTPTTADVLLKESPVPKVEEDGTFLVRCLELSLDPYMRGMMNERAYGMELPYPRKMHADAVGQVVESKNDKFPVGSIVCGAFGWCDYCLHDGAGVAFPALPRVIPPTWKRSHALSVLGMPGATAYLGFVDIIAPKAGETMAVSSCTGAVGQLVGQIAKNLGCRTVGITSAGKADVAKRFGYDAVVEYSGKDVATLTKELAAAAPDGINGYFDNTGGVCSEAVFNVLAPMARVSVCGQISYYNSAKDKEGLGGGAAGNFLPLLTALSKQLKIEGFMCVSLPREKPGDWSEAHAKLQEWLESGKLVVEEDVTDGLENALDAFLSLFHEGGKKINVGKKVVKIAEPPLPLPSA